MRARSGDRHVEIKPPYRGKVLHVIANEFRSEIIERLAMAPMDVTSLAQSMELDVKYVSHHLGLLLKCSLVRVRAEGTRHWYQLSEIVKTSIRGEHLRIRIDCAGGRHVVLHNAMFKG